MCAHVHTLVSVHASLQHVYAYVSDESLVMVGACAGIATGTAAAPIVTETGIGNDAMTAAGLTGTVTETERSEIFALWRLAVKERA